MSSAGETVLFVINPIIESSAVRVDNMIKQRLIL